MNDIPVRPPTPRMAAFLIVGAALLLHAAVSRALPNHALGSAWVESVQRACRDAPGCAGVQITAATGFLFWTGRQVKVSARPGQEDAALAAVRAAIGVIGRAYSEVEVTRVGGAKR